MGSEARGRAGAAATLDAGAPLDGVLLADKPPGPSSHAVVAALRRALGATRVGHAGTLDPFASGLLVLLVGRATRLAEYASALDKTYLATVRLGAESTTDDPEGELTPADPPPQPPLEGEVRAALGAFLGVREQVPPAFSAKRVGGVRAYRLARRGTPVALAPRAVRIERLELLAYSFPNLELRITAGPGTYVRSLARDLGHALGTRAYLAALRRVAIGPFSVGDAVDVATTPAAGLSERVLPPEAAVGHLPEIALEDAAARALVQGRPLTACAGAVRGPLRLRGAGGFLGIGSVGPEGLRAVKVLFPERARP